MGSEYKVVENKGASVDLLLQEMSNTFDLVVCSGPGSRNEAGEEIVDVTLLKHASPEQLVEVAFKIIQVAAYWEGGRKLRDLIEKKLSEIYFLDD